MPINPHMTPEVADLIRKGGAPWLTPRSNAKAIEEKSRRDAERVNVPEMPKGEETEWHQINSESKNIKTGKRGYPKASSGSMEFQPNQDRVNQLQAQIAVLQRNLQHELHGTTPPEEEA